MKDLQVKFTVLRFGETSSLVSLPYLKLFIKIPASIFLANARKSTYALSLMYSCLHWVAVIQHSASCSANRHFPWACSLDVWQIYCRITDSQRILEMVYSRTPFSVFSFPSGKPFNIQTQDHMELLLC